MKPLDIFHAPLSGVNLIEASAGTGKTYTIEGIYLRLILERALNLEQILVVTFTRAATDELRNRIRTKLLGMSEALKTGHAEDPFIEDMIAGIDDIPGAQEKIKNALVDFDKAAIYTIHGFCQRILTENAFETHNLFDFDVIADQSELLRDVAEDFWRSQFYQAPVELAVYANARLSGPVYFINLAVNLDRQNMTIIPKLRRPVLDEALNDLRSCFKTVKNSWYKSKQDVLNCLKDPSLSGNVYGSLKPDNDYPYMNKRDIRLQVLEKEMDRFAEKDYPALPLFARFKHFTETKINLSTKKNCLPPYHPFFTLCDKFLKKSRKLETEMNEFLEFLQGAFFLYAQKELAERKNRTSMVNFDDLLVMVKKALDGKYGQHLLNKIRQTYKAALVDEFQDTDAVQYDIFSKIFAHKDSLFLMIGDPKQAIYDFRGADIFSYMDAAEKTQHAYTLLQNHRSDPCLISAVNTIFSNQFQPFLFKKIRFEKTAPGKSLSYDIPEIRPGFIIWHMFSEAGTGQPHVISRQAAMPRVADAVAGEILQLVNDFPKTLKLSDIAVLVRTNRQAKLMKDHLSAANIACVLHQTGNIFETHEALEMQRILLGISEAGNERFLKAALCTDMLGFTASDFQVSDPSGVLEILSSRFKKYSTVWKKSGFIRMFRHLLSEEKVKERLMTYSDGERRLTNIIHLSEILHKTDIEKKAGMKGLVKWLNEKRTSIGTDVEEHLIRLETDANAVNILTIHKSKGLEFPIVFCPFPWDGSILKNKQIQFHDPENDYQRVLDLGSADFDEHKRHAQHERLAENLRLLYVALTRAKKRCYIAWGRINKAETSAAAYLFHYSGDIADDMVGELKKKIAAASDDDLLGDLKQLVLKSDHAISVKALPRKCSNAVYEKKLAATPLRCKDFSGSISHVFGVASYSSLVAGHIADDGEMDRDTVPPGVERKLQLKNRLSEDDLPADDSDIMQFPKGARTGLFFHDLFEHVVFEKFTDGDDSDLIKEKLREYGFDASWRTVVEKMIQHVLSTRLRADENTIVLASIPKGNRVHEMEFYFRLKKIDPDTLSSALGSHIDDPVRAGYHLHLDKLTFSPVKGFMKGYIDMVFIHENRFYILDWKSNYLGPSREHYRREILWKIMQDHHYVLQYHLYVLALHQFLKLRIPAYQYERDFGGVFYLYIRGMDSRKSDGAGIFFDKPGFNRINTLETLLIKNNGEKSDAAASTEKHVP